MDSVSVQRSWTSSTPPAVAKSVAPTGAVSLAPTTVSPSAETSAPPHSPSPSTSAAPRSPRRASWQSDAGTIPPRPPELSAAARAVQKTVQEAIPERAPAEILHIAGAPPPASPPQASIPQEPMPVTSPKKPWDRVALTATPHHGIWRDSLVGLDVELPEGAGSPEHVAGGVMIYAVQILLGHRPLSHLRNWLDPAVFAALSRRAGLAMRIEGKAPACPPPRICRLRMTSPLPRVAETIAAIHDGVRVRAAALRLEYHGKRWKVMALELG
ncbi:Uncharacterised protein [Actinobaculum suis]|uniref:Uncharacterized protein n=1 Tax=Actinobaculum suis TaxID=1657 RepID=A0A7Z9C928_9ACTO|nr:Rv3235 family protein [Actinobaculum suis]VDG77099.1 Uncharacterised protein [Actinobaculum suis]